MTINSEHIQALKGNQVRDSYYLVECGECGEIYPSNKLAGGCQIADTGDYGDCYCPHCDASEEYEDLGNNAASAWNYQQKRIDALLAEHDADKALIAELSAHLRNAHAFIENTEAFGGEAATGIIKCGGAEWNIDASKAALVSVEN